MSLDEVDTSISRSTKPLSSSLNIIINMSDFKAVILAHTFVPATQKTSVAQITELAAQNSVTLEWAEAREGPDHATIWHCYPIGQCFALLNRSPC